MRRVPRCPRSIRHRWQFAIYPAILFAMVSNPATTYAVLGYNGLVGLAVLLATVQLWASWSSLYDTRGDLRLAAVGLLQLYGLVREVAA